MTSDEQTAREEQTTTVKKRRNKADVVINVALWIVLAILIVLVVLRLFVFSSIKVEGPSMYPTYNGGEKDDVVVVNKTKMPNRGDVIVFYKYDVDSKLKAMFANKEDSGPDGKYEKLIKRVVGVAGDKIWVDILTDDGAVQVYEVIIETADGQRLLEDYYVKKGEPIDQITISSVGVGLGRLEGCTKTNPFVVSEGHVFVMGDNRTVSADSRGELGEVPLTHMYGVVMDK